MLRINSAHVTNIHVERRLTLTPITHTTRNLKLGTEN